MATECRQDSLDFGTVEGRSVVGAFDGGVISSDAGALLLGATNRAIRLVGRFAATFSDRREAENIEHTVTTLVGQRLFAIALGYEDLNDHDELRHDPVMAVLAGKLKARRKRSGRLFFGEPGPGAAGAIYDMLNEDKRKAIEIIVEEKAEATDPETADGNLPELESPGRPRS